MLDEDVFDNNFLGVYSQDDPELLGDVKKIQPKFDSGELDYFFYIQNTDDFDEDGEHWYVVYIDHNSAHLFDS